MAIVTILTECTIQHVYLSAPDLVLLSMSYQSKWSGLSEKGCTASDEIKPFNHVSCYEIKIWGVSKFFEGHENKNSENDLLKST